MATRSKTLNVYVASEEKPEVYANVLVAGGLAYWDGARWYSCYEKRPIAWTVKWWAPIPCDVEVPPVDAEPSEPQAPQFEITGIRLTREGQDAVVSVELDGTWCLVIKEPLDGYFDHIVNVGGIVKAMEDHVRRLKHAAESVVLTEVRSFADGLVAFLDKHGIQRQKT